MDLDELFVPIPFFENFAVSNYGTVIHLETGIEVRQWLNRVHDRMKVRFPVNAAYIDFFVDDLVTQAFFVEWKPGIKIYYKNGNKTDCTVLNLSFDRKYATEGPPSRLYVDDKGKLRARRGEVDD